LLSRLARSRRGLTAIAVVTGVLILTLSGALALVLSSTTHGGQAQNGQSGQNQNGQAGNAVVAQTATADGVGNGTPSGGGSSGGGGTHPTPTPTSSRGSATPTPTSGSATGCCLTLSPAVHQVVSQVTLSGTRVGPVIATCPSGEIALSGGWAVAYNSGATIYRSARLSAQSWAVYVMHSSSVGVTTYAECLANASGAAIVERDTYESAGSGSFNETAASCTGAETLVGGGFALSTSQIDLLAFGPSNVHPSVWYSEEYNLSGSSAQIYLYAECMTLENAHSSEIASAQASVGDGATGGETTGACPSGRYVSAGGYGHFTGTRAPAFIYAMWASNNNTTWTADVYANGGDSESLNSYALCLGF
jgi:hypothetical protein